MKIQGRKAGTSKYFTFLKFSDGHILCRDMQSIIAMIILKHFIHMAMYSKYVYHALQLSAITALLF